MLRARSGARGVTGERVLGLRRSVCEGLLHFGDECRTLALGGDA